MDKISKSTACAQHGLARLAASTTEDLTTEEVDCLLIARLFFASFAAPQSQAWMRAFDEAKKRFYGEQGLTVAHSVLKVLRAVRSSRVSVFRFNSPYCANCCTQLSEHEQRVMTAITAMRAGRQGQARIELILLCEGNGIEPSMTALQELAVVLNSSHSIPLEGKI